MAETAISRPFSEFADSDLSFYQIASLIGTSGTIPSTWLARTAKPDKAELAEIERLLTAGQLQTHEDDSHSDRQFQRLSGKP